MLIKHKEGIILAVMVILFAIASAYSIRTPAAELGPNVDVTFLYVAPALTSIDNKTEPTIMGGIRHSWHPVDLVAEVIVREQSSVNLLAAKGFGDIRIMGGIGLQAGSINPSLIFGADYKRITMRLSIYETASTNTVPGECWRRRCRPETTTTNKSHAALMVGYVIPIGAR